MRMFMNCRDLPVVAKERGLGQVRTSACRVRLLEDINRFDRGPVPARDAPLINCASKSASPVRIYVDASALVKLVVSNCQYLIAS
jgi:hypothetical protein